MTDEIALDESPGCVADDHRVGQGNPLEASCDVRRLPQRQLLLSATRPDLADHHETRVNANAHGQPDTLLVFQPRIQGPDGLDDLASRTDRPLGIILVRLGVAEVDQQPVPEILGDPPLKALDHFGACRLVGANHLPQILRVKPASEGRGLDQITEQDRELAAFGLRRTALDRGGCPGRGREPDEDASVLIPGYLLRVEEFVLEGLEGVIIQVELRLERSIGHSFAALQHGNGTINDFLEGHSVPSRRLARFSLYNQRSASVSNR